MEELKITKQKVRKMLTDLESELIERTISINNTDKFGQAVCAFSNDLPNHAQNGYLLIGVNDDGSLSGLKVTDKFLQTLGGLRSDGNILPQPILSVKAFSFDDGDVVVLEICPSPFPPVRYKGKTWIRVGPRKAVASEMEERILIERRSANVSTFDIRPCLDSSLEDVQPDSFKQKYLPQAIDKDSLNSDTRNIKEQLAALRFYNTRYDKPTHAGILLLGKNPEYFIPGGDIQYVRFKGSAVAGDIINEKKFSGNLISVLEKIENFIDDAVIMQRPIPLSTLREKSQKNYPNWAIRELMMNAVMHRGYESNAPIKFYQFDNRIEISNAGGLYGKARPENFPDENDYRNPTLAEAMKVLGYVNRFNRGIARVKEELNENGNPEAIFEIHKIGAFGVTIYNAFTESNEDIKSNQELGADDWVKIESRLGEKLGENQIQILKLMHQNSKISIVEISTKLELSTTAIENNIKKLREKNILEHVGPAKGGQWRIIF